VNFVKSAQRKKLIIAQGNEGERRLNAWFNAQGMSYVFINQDRKHFARLFQGELKRPDFLMLLEGIGILAVDAKFCSPNDYGNYTLGEDELRKAANFERLFRIPVWYAFLVEEDGLEQWLWISLLKTLEVGVDRGEYRTIQPDEFVVIEGNEDLGRLYSQRLPSLKRVGSI
jgi:hypothetical protein